MTQSRMSLLIICVAFLISNSFNSSFSSEASADSDDAPAAVRQRDAARGGPGVEKIREHGKGGIYFLGYAFHFNFFSAYLT